MPKHSLDINISQDGPNKKLRSDKAQDLHTLVMGYITKRCALRDIKVFLDKCDDLSFIGERSANGFSVLDDIAHIISNNYGNGSEATKKFAEIWDIITPKIPSNININFATQANKEGFTLAQQAAYSGNPEIAKIIFDFIGEALESEPGTHISDAGATTEQLMQPNNDGWNAAHVAVFNNHFDALKVLIKKGVTAEQLRKTNKYGRTPADIAAQEGYLNIQTAIEKHISSSNNSGHFTSKLNDDRRLTPVRALL